MQVTIQHNGETWEGVLAKRPDIEEPDERVIGVWSLGQVPEQYARTIARARYVGCNALMLYSGEMAGHVPPDMNAIVEARSWDKNLEPVAVLDRFKQSTRYAQLTLGNRLLAMAIDQEAHRWDGTVQASMCEWMNLVAPNVKILSGPLRWDGRNWINYPWADGLMGFYNVSYARSMAEDMSWYEALYRRASCVAPAWLSPQLMLSGNQAAADPAEVSAALRILKCTDTNIMLWGMDDLPEGTDLTWLRDVLAEPDGEPGPPMTVGIPDPPDVTGLRAACRIVHHAGYTPVLVFANAAPVFRVEDIEPLAGDWWPQYKQGLGAFNDRGKATYAIRDRVREAEMALGRRLRAEEEG